MIDEKVLIERLEDFKYCIDGGNSLCELGRKVGYDQCIEIVNQLAEETIHESSSKSENVLESGSRSRKVIYK